MRDCYVDFCVFESKENWLTSQKELYPMSGWGRVRYCVHNMHFINGECAFYKISDDYKYVSIPGKGGLPLDLFRVKNIQSTPIKGFLDRTPTKKALDMALFNFRYQRKIHNENAMLLKFAKDNKHIKSGRRWYDDLPGQCGYY